MLPSSLVAEPCSLRRRCARVAYVGKGCLSGECELGKGMTGMNGVNGEYADGMRYGWPVRFFQLQSKYEIIEVRT